MKPKETKIREPREKTGDTEDVTLPPAPLLSPFISDQTTALECSWGFLPNCYLIAILAAMANTPLGRARIRRMLRMDEHLDVVSELPLGRGIVRTKGLVFVQFPTYGRPIPISRLLYRAKDGEIRYGHSTKRHGWLSFVEKAYIVLHELQHKRDRFGYDIFDLTVPETPVWQNLILGVHASPHLYVINRRTKPGPILQILRKATTRPTTATTIYKRGVPQNPKTGIWYNHAHAVLGVRTVKSVRTGKSKSIVDVLGEAEAGSQEVSIQDFLNDFHHIVQCEVKDAR